MTESEYYSPYDKCIKSDCSDYPIFNDFIESFDEPEEEPNN